MTTAHTGTSFGSSEEGARNFFRDEIIHDFDSDDESLLTEQLARVTSRVKSFDGGASPATTALSSKLASPINAENDKNGDNNNITSSKEYLNVWDMKNFGIFSNQFATGFALYFFQTLP